MLRWSAAGIAAVLQLKLLTMAISVTGTIY
jgi:hypothetical protein